MSKTSSSATRLSVSPIRSEMPSLSVENIAREIILSVSLVISSAMLTSLPAPLVGSLAVVFDMIEQHMFHGRGIGEEHDAAACKPGLGDRLLIGKARNGVQHIVLRNSEKLDERKQLLGRHGAGKNGCRVSDG